MACVSSLSLCGGALCLQVCMRLGVTVTGRLAVTPVVRIWMYPCHSLPVRGLARCVADSDAGRVCRWCRQQGRVCALSQVSVMHVTCHWALCLLRHHSRQAALLAWNTGRSAVCGLR